MQDAGSLRGAGTAPPLIESGTLTSGGGLVYHVRSIPSGSMKGLPTGAVRALTAQTRRQGLGKKRTRIRRHFLFYTCKTRHSVTLRRVLLVEDNPDDESLTQRGLRGNDWSVDVTVASDGAMALEMLESADKLPDLLLLDLKLPKFDGAEVLRQTRDNERTRCLCIVIFTSSNDPRDIARCHELGCNSYVVKPVAYESYIETVRQIGTYWLALNTISPNRG